MVKKAILWIAVISCMLAIFIFSSQEANVSDKTSSGFIELIVRLFDFKKNLTPEKAAFLTDKLSVMVRKTAHFMIYALLGFLISNLAFVYGIYKKKGTEITVFTSLLYAISDEVHQTFVIGRSGQISDVCLDTAGAFCGLIFAGLIRFIINLIKERKNTTNELQ